MPSARYYTGSVVFDDYQALKNQALWKPLPEYTREEFSVGIMGAGVLGAKVAESLQAWGFPLRCWSRSRKSWPGVESYVGREELSRVPEPDAGAD